MEEFMSFKKFINDKKSALDTKKETIQITEDEIYQLFDNFLIDYQNNNIDFQNLSNSQVAILNATPLGFKLLLEEGQSFKVKKVTRNKIYIMYYYDANFNPKRESSKITLKKDFMHAHSWSEFSDINLSIEHINVDKAVFNLSKDTGISIFAKDEDSVKKLLKPLVKRIKSKLKEFIDSQNVDSNCEELNILPQNRKVV